MVEAVVVQGAGTGQGLATLLAGVPEVRSWKLSFLFKLSMYSAK